MEWIDTFHEYRKRELPSAGWTMLQRACAEPILPGRRSERSVPTSLCVRT